MYIVVFFNSDKTFDVLKQRGHVGDTVIVKKYPGEIIGNFGKHYILGVIS